MRVVFHDPCSPCQFCGLYDFRIVTLQGIIYGQQSCVRLGIAVVEVYACISVEHKQTIWERDVDYAIGIAHDVHIVLTFANVVSLHDWQNATVVNVITAAISKMNAFLIFFCF